MNTLREYINLIEQANQGKVVYSHAANCNYKYGHDCNCTPVPTHSDNCNYKYGHDCDCYMNKKVDKKDK